MDIVNLLVSTKLASLEYYQAGMRRKRLQQIHFAPIDKHLTNHFIDLVFRYSQFSGQTFVLLTASITANKHPKTQSEKPPMSRVFYKYSKPV